MLRIIITLVLLVCTSSRASTTALSLPDFFSETWNTRSGLPHNSINSLAQTQDGYIWVATWEGLARYNGREFKLFTRTEIPGLPDSGLRSLISQPNGDLYIVGARGGIALRKQNQWQSLPSAPAMINHALHSSKGELWLALEGSGIVKQNANASGYNIVLPNISAYRLVEDNEGVIWAATSNGLYKISETGVSPIGTDSGLPDAPVFALLLDKDGALLVGTEKGAWLQQKNHFTVIHPALENESISSLLQDQQGALWFGTINKGVFRLSELGLENLNADNGLPANRILSLLEDRESSIWVGTNAGLYRLRAVPFANWDKTRGLAGNYVRTVMSHSDKSIWVGSSNGLNRIQGEQVTTLTQAYAEDPLSVLSLAEDGKGSVWVGTYTSGLMKVVNNKVYPVKNRSSGLASNEVRALLIDKQQGIWIGTASGLNVLTSSGQISTYNEQTGLPGNFIMALSQDKHGYIWVGTGVGVARFDESKAQFETIKFPSRFNTEYAFGFYEDDKYMWMATDRGLVRYQFSNDEMRLFGRQQGLPVDKLFQIVEHSGSLWLTSNRGIIQVNKQHVNNILDNPGSAKTVSAQLYDEGDGMLSAQANGGSNPAATLSYDNAIWVATAKGLTTFTPEKLKAGNQQRLSTVIESFTVDGKLIPLPTSNKPLVLAAGVSRLSFQYAGLSYIMPQRLNYQTQLTGYNNKWVDRERLAVTEYTNLAPGKYTFQVRAGYPNSEWQNNQQLLTFIIQPHFWQQASFKVFMLLLFVLICVGIYKYRSYHFKRVEMTLTKKIEQQMHDLQQQADAFAHLANHDQLTQLSNRRAFDKALATNFGAAQKNNLPIAVAILDIDHFKVINDTYSHLIGDGVIRKIAQLLKHHREDETHVARWGGEEFTVLFPGQTAEQALKCCELIREQIQSYDFSSIAPNLSVTVSIGIADNNHLDDYDRLLAQADNALYRAKEQGRNRVIVF